MLTTLFKVALMLAFSTLAIAGCRSGSSASAQAPTLPDDETDWFCQEDGESNEWDCIQDDALARNPESGSRASKGAKNSSD